jgi:hypothetical protein
MRQAKIKAEADAKVAHRALKVAVYLVRGCKRKFIRQEKVIPRHKQWGRDAQRLHLVADIVQWLALARRVLYLDEIVFSKLSMPKLEWSARGRSITVNKDKVRTGYFAVCAVIEFGAGIQGLHIQPRALNAFDFCQFLYWLPFTNLNEPLCIFMDNLSVHKTPGTYAAMRFLNIKPLYNLAYSPEYNPIELVFSMVKHNFKQARLRTLANGAAFDMVPAVEDAFYAVPPAKMEPCIRHSDALLRDMNR